MDRASIEFSFQKHKVVSIPWDLGGTISSQIFPYVWIFSFLDCPKLDFLRPLGNRFEITYFEKCFKHMIHIPNPKSNNYNCVKV